MYVCVSIKPNRRQLRSVNAFSSNTYNVKSPTFSISARTGARDVQKHALDPRQNSIVT